MQSLAACGGEGMKRNQAGHGQNCFVTENLKVRPGSE